MQSRVGGRREIVIFSLLIVLFMTSYACSSFSEESRKVPKPGIHADKGVVLFEDLAMPWRYLT